MSDLTPQQQQVDNLNKVEMGLVSRLKGLEVDRGITFPKGYDSQKAVTNAMLTIKQDPKLSSCTPESIGQSVLNMVTMGLDIGSKQAYLIPYGGKAQLSVSYFGTQTVLRRITGVLDVYANVILEGDDFEVDYDEERNLRIQKHDTSWKNQGKPIEGAYCIIKLDNNVFGKEEYVELMTMEQIKNAWGQGATKGNSPAHKTFPDQMAKKSVINRAAKNFTNTLTDIEDNTIVKAFNETIQGEYEVKKHNADQPLIQQDLAQEVEVIDSKEEDLSFDM